MIENQFSRESRFVSRLCKGSLMLCATALMLTSCAQDGYDDGERFVSNVSGVALTSPQADQITVTPSADGKSQTITWPVVVGAGGYLFSFFDAGAMDAPIVKDSLIDGCSVTVKREEDMNYVARIKTMGKPSANNSEAAEATELHISTFTATYKTIPAGADLNEWFAANPVPDEAVGSNLNYDLEAGSTYTVSGELDFDGHWVTLRSNSKTSPATINYTTEASCINFAAPFSAKYLKFDCSGMAANNGVFGFSKAPTAARDAATEFVIFGGNVTIVNCTFDNVNGYFFWDNRKDQKVAAVQFLIDNCVVEMTPPASNSGAVIWTNKGGHINDLTISNSTFYNSSAEGDVKYFYQAGMYRAKDINMGADQGGPGNSVIYKNCTFYRLGWNGGQWGNYNGMNGKTDSYWTLTDCIFYACSQGGGVPRRFLHGKSNQPTAKFANNTYMQADGTFDNVGEYDTSGTQIEEDPQFANPNGGDFHIGGATQLSRRTGDPRWLP